MIEPGYFLRTLAMAVAMVVVCYIVMIAVCALTVLVF